VRCVNAPFPYSWVPMAYSLIPNPDPGLTTDP
jgi:hypothetical protein